MSEHGFQVMAERCDQCLYGHNKIVSNHRRKQILLDIGEEDKFFVCHKATIVGKTVACRGDWDQRRCGQMGQVAERLSAMYNKQFVHFINESDLTPD